MKGFCTETSLKDGEYLDARSNILSECLATGVIYAILCQRCHMLYIGETSRKLANRSGEHLRSVDNSRYQLLARAHVSNNMCIIGRACTVNI